MPDVSIVAIRPPGRSSARCSAVAHAARTGRAKIAVCPLGSQGVLLMNTRHWPSLAVVSASRANRSDLGDSAATSTARTRVVVSKVRAYGARKSRQMSGVKDQRRPLKIVIWFCIGSA